MSGMHESPPVVEPGTAEAEILDEELRLLGTVQQQLAQDQLDRQSSDAEYDTELVSLRDQIADARLEDVAPLVTEMYRLQALGAANGKGKDLPVDVACPYFGHLRLNDGKRSRDVLIGSRGFVKAGSKANIVDWRNAPVSRIYYCYEEGDDYEENFGGRMVQGIVEARRTLSIVDGQLRRVSWATGTLIKRGEQWLALTHERQPTLSGGAGVSVRPPPMHEPPPAFEPGRLGVVSDESLREDKHLKEITALIDQRQFELITAPESGIVILQGGAGSGKTTVALHRAAYLHFENPNIFSPKRMVVVVKSEPLTEYISRVLPSLDVAGTQVITLEKWMENTRRRVLPELKQKRVEEVAGNVVRLKKHPAILATLERGIQLEADRIERRIGSVIEDKGARHSVVDKWRGLKRLALLPRLREMSKWLDTPNAQRAGVKGRVRSDLQGTLRRARESGDDVMSLWSDILTDTQLIQQVAEERGDQLDPVDVKDLVRWVSMQADEPLPKEDEDDEEKAEKGRAKARSARADARSATGRNRRGDGADGDEVEDDRSTGIDGRRLDEDAPYGKLDPHDDALLLKLTQLLYGGLPIAGSQKSVTYEHIVVDEAQDLSPTDIGVLKGALTKRESMTLAGDTAQKLIFDNGFDTWDKMLEDVGVAGVKIDQLKVSYRSTRPVVEFSRHVLGPLADPDPPQVPRDGAPVEQFRFGSTGEAVAFLGAQLRSLVLRERKANIAVISRYKAQSDMYYEGLRNSEVPGLRRVHGKDFSFAPGIDVVEVSQIKGLEYDYVILTEVNENSYPERTESRHLLHIAATRAVHQLWVVSTGKPSTLLPEPSY